MAIEDLFFQAIMADTILTEATAAIVPISMVREFSKLEGVVRIRELEKSTPS